MPNYAKMFQQNTQPTINSMKLKAGLATMGSENSIISQEGKSLIDSVIPQIKTSSDIYPTKDKNKLNPKLATGLQVAGQVLGSVSDIIPSLDEIHNSNDELSADIRGGASKALLSGVAGPWGQLAGGLLMGIDKTGGFTDASKGLGGVNDALNMVASFAIPGAGWFTSKTMDYDVSETLQQNGASYSGTLDKANTAAQNAGAKILFGRGKANSMIGNAILADTKVQNIMDENEIAQAGASNPFIGLRNQFNMQGGWQQGAIRYGRKGMSIQILERAKSIIANMKDSHKQESSSKESQDRWAEELQYNSIPEHKNGGSIIEIIPIPTEILLINPADIPEFQKGEQINKKSRTLEELIQYAKEVNPRFIQRMSEPLKYVEWDDNEGHHFGTHELGYTEMDGKYFVYPSIQEGNDGSLIRYTPEDWKQAVDNAYKNKNGLFFNTEEEAKIFTESQENPDGTFSGYKSGWSEFFKQKPTKYQNGGAINVIPDGALHARKHNMDMEGITKKGIPVVADKENGGIEQQAEIEKEEIIFILEVTKKLEELEKKYYNPDTSQKEKDALALEAGKLLVQEILYNTMDNVNLIDKV